MNLSRFSCIKFMLSCINCNCEDLPIWQSNSIRFMRLHLNLHNHYSFDVPTYSLNSIQTGNSSPLIVLNVVLYALIGTNSITLYIPYNQKHLHCSLSLIILESHSFKSNTSDTLFYTCFSNTNNNNNTTLSQMYNIFVTPPPFSFVNSPGKHPTTLTITPPSPWLLCCSTLAIDNN